MAKDHIKTLDQMFNHGALNAAWNYAKKGVVIEMRISDLKQDKDRIYTIKKEEDKAVVEEGRSEKPDALCTMTTAALDYLSQARDYLEAGRRIYEMRVYPTGERKMVWETVISAIEAYEKLFVFYRKLGMN